MSKSRFKIEGRFDGAREATVTIDRGSMVFSVRPYRRRQDFALPLSEVAEMVLWRIVKADAAAKREARKKRS